MASETTTTVTTTAEVIEVPAEAKTLIIDPPTTDVEAVVPSTNGTTAAPTATTTTEEASTPVAEKPEEKKVVDPREDAVEWIKSLIPAGVHKVNHQILTWLNTDGQPLPGKNEAVTKNQFMNFLKDGSVLAKFANTLSPGAIEKVFEGEEAKVKENQVVNVQNFLTFVKEKAGFTDSEVFEVDDLQEKGKSGYNAVFNTLFQLGTKAQEKFNASGIDVDAIIAVASSAVKNSIIQAILNFFQRARPQLKSKGAASAAETSEVAAAVEKPVTNGNGVVATTTEEVVVPTPNGEAAVPPVPTSAAPAISAQ